MVALLTTATRTYINSLGVTNLIFKYSVLHKTYFVAIGNLDGWALPEMLVCKYYFRVGILLDIEFVAILRSLIHIVFNLARFFTKLTKVNSLLQIQIQLYTNMDVSRF